MLGYVIHHHRAILATFTRHTATFAMLALVLFPIAVYLSELERAGFSVRLHTAVVIAQAFCTWALIYAFAGLFLRYLDTASPWTLYISQSSYWVYLTHVPVITLAAWWILPWDLHAFVKFPIIFLFTAIACFTSYHYLVQRTWISVFLNGRRFDLKWPWLERRQTER
jgi:glucan biosynthesis protein C